MVSRHSLLVSHSAWSVTAKKSKLEQNLAKLQASATGCTPSPCCMGKFNRKASNENVE